MDKISKLYYINLNRCPERNTSFLNECRKQDIPFSKIQRFEAVDGTTFSFTPEIENMFKNCDYFRTLALYRKNNMDERNYNISLQAVKKIMGNQLSHYSLLHDILNNGYEYAIICQDDAKFNNNFVNYIDKLMENLPEDTELINIGLNKVADGAITLPWDFGKEDDSEIAKEMVNDYVCKLKEDTNPCSLAYIVTLQGARNLIRYFSTVGFLKAADCNYNDYLMRKNNYYCCRKIMVTSGDFRSDIFTHSAVLEGYNGPLY
jgi:GR25 family glycosyltransferase involved in LPS biosynthesis